MRLYDDIILKINSLCNNPISLDFTNQKVIEADKNAIIFKNDLAYELGGGNNKALGGSIITSNKDLITEDEIILIGSDLDKINSDTNYARIALVLVDETKMGEGNTLYSNIRKIDYVRYHVNPLGFMVRISPIASKESVRISKKAIKDGLNFAKVGASYLKEYHKLDAILAVKLIFITDSNFDYDNLNSLLAKNENITKALDHLLNKVKMDCHSCNLQIVCQEVEELTKKDFN